MTQKIISGYVDVPPEDREAFARALPEHSRLTNLETGCIYFRVTPHAGIAGRWSVEEAFDDEAAYAVHMERTRKTEWFEVTRNIARSYGFMILYFVKGFKGYIDEKIILSSFDFKRMC